MSLFGCGKRVEANHEILIPKFPAKDGSAKYTLKAHTQATLKSAFLKHLDTEVVHPLNLVTFSMHD